MNPATAEVDVCEVAKGDLPGELSTDGIATSNYKWLDFEIYCKRGDDVEG